MIYMMHEESAPNMAQRRFPKAYDGEAIKTLFSARTRRNMRGYILTTAYWRTHAEHHKHMIIIMGDDRRRWMMT